MNEFRSFRFIFRFAMAIGVLIAAGLSTELTTSRAQASDVEQQTKASSEQVEKLIGAIRQNGAMSDKDLVQRRADFEKLMASTPDPTRVQIRHVDANGIDANLVWPARLHHPIGRRAILYLHGGGFYSGSLRTHRNIAALLAKAASADVLLIDYRLAPDYGFPAQINDAMAAYRWLLSSGYKAGNIVIAGESVGATLAIEVVLNQIRFNGALPAAVIAMSPVTDFAGTGESLAANAAQDPFMGKAELAVIHDAVARGHSAVDPDLSPLYASFARFPPLLIQVGSRETLLDDSRRLADKVQQAGGNVSLEVWPGMIHQWQIFPFWLDDARKAGGRAAEFASSHFADKPGP
ncbi:alpha/beta hydrolase [Rhizobium sp. BR 315]|uniref:Acetyl esterase/lipase n=2 Tax=Rhizobium/Agrobacterium group TaxID=227290 RepID=A0A1C3VDD2_9HYPH|nr:alpha/beta hydrolase [Rhizobium miluonense]SCB25792.1 Acetyl esterase/lipase [Rhizobium miluonense]